MFTSDCTALKLTSASGRPYWFRTCDIGGDIWADGAHVVSFPAGAEVTLARRETPLKVKHALVGMTDNSLDTWLLDGVNDAGMVGGLLALYEAVSADRSDPGFEGIVGMEMITALLATCGSVAEVVEAARRVQVLSIPMPDGSVNCTMHYMFTDPTGACVILEAADPERPGMLTIYQENLGMMTNSPPYPEQLRNLAWYLSQSPELRFGVEGKRIDSITLNGMTVQGDAAAPHFTRTDAFPGSYAACDRFIRTAVLSCLNREGKDISDEQMLPLGSNLMSAVFEPHNQGVYHYIRLDEQDTPVGQHESYTQYLVMYDLTQRALYLRPYDTTAWTRITLAGCSDTEIQRHPVCREALGGVIRNN